MKHYIKPEFKLKKISAEPLLDVSENGGVVDTGDAKEDGNAEHARSKETFSAWDEE